MKRGPKGVKAPVICLEISLNGKVIARAGGENVWHVKTAVWRYKGRSKLSAHGLYKPQETLDQWVHWIKEKNLKTGDKLTIQLVSGREPTRFTATKSFGTLKLKGKPEEYFCTFCGKSGKDGGMLLAQLANICHECLRLHYPGPPKDERTS